MAKQREMSNSPAAFLKKLMGLMVADEQTMEGLGPTELEAIFRKLSEGQRERLLKAAQDLASTVKTGARPDLVEALDSLDDVRETIEKESRVVLAKKPKAVEPTEPTAVSKIMGPKAKAAKGAKAAPASEPTAPTTPTPAQPVSTSPPVEPSGPVPSPDVPAEPAAAPAAKQVLFDSESKTNKPLSRTEDRQLRSELDKLKNEIATEKGMESLTPEGKAIWLEAKTARAEAVAAKLGIPLKAEHFVKKVEPAAVPAATAPTAPAAAVPPKVRAEMLKAKIPAGAQAFDELLAELAGAGLEKEARVLQNAEAGLGGAAVARFGNVDDALKNIAKGRTKPENFVTRTAKNLLGMGGESVSEMMAPSKGFQKARELAGKAAAGVEGLEAYGGVKGALKGTAKGLMSLKTGVPLLFLGLAAKNFMDKKSDVEKIARGEGVPRVVGLEEVTRKIEMDRLIMGRRQQLEANKPLMEDVVRVLSGQSVDKGLTGTEIQIGNVMKGRSPADTQKLLDVLLGRLATYDKKTGERTPIENPLAPDL